MDTPTPIIPAPETPIAPENSNTKKIAIGVVAVAVIAVAALFGGNLFKGSFIADDLKKGLESAQFSLKITRDVTTDGFSGKVVFNGQKLIKLNDKNPSTMTGAFTLTGTRTIPASQAEFDAFLKKNKSTALNTLPQFVLENTKLIMALASAIDAKIASTTDLMNAETDEVKKNVYSETILALNVFKSDKMLGLLTTVMKPLADYAQAFDKGSADPSTIKPILTNFQAWKNSLQLTASGLDTDEKFQAALTELSNAYSNKDLLFYQLLIFAQGFGSNTYNEFLGGTFSLNETGNIATVNTKEHSVTSLGKEQSEIETTTLTLDATKGDKEIITTTITDPVLSKELLENFYTNAHLARTAMSYQTIFSDIASQLMNADATQLCGLEDKPINVSFKTGENTVFTSCNYTLDTTEKAIHSIQFKGTGDNAATYHLQLTNPTYAAPGSEFNIYATDAAQPSVINFQKLDEKNPLTLPSSFVVTEAPQDITVHAAQKLSIQKTDGTWTEVISHDLAPWQALACVKGQKDCNTTFIYVASEVSKYFTSPLNNEYAFTANDKPLEYRLKIHLSLSGGAGAQKEKNMMDNEKIYHVVLNYYADNKDQGGVELTPNKENAATIPVPFSASLPSLQDTEVPIFATLDDSPEVLYSANVTFPKGKTSVSQGVGLSSSVGDTLFSKLSDNKKHVLHITLNKDGKVKDFPDDNTLDLPVSIAGVKAPEGKNALKKVAYKNKDGADTIILNSFDPAKDKTIVIANKDLPQPHFESLFSYLTYNEPCTTLRFYDAKGKLIHSEKHTLLEEMLDLTEKNGKKFVLIHNFSIPYTAENAKALKDSNGSFDLVFNDVCGGDKKPAMGEEDLTDNVQHYYLPPADADVKVLTADPVSVTSGSLNVSVGLAPTAVGTDVKLKGLDDILSFDPPLPGITVTDDLKFTIAKVPDVAAATPYKLMIHKKNLLYAKSTFTVNPVKPDLNIKIESDKKNFMALTVAKLGVKDYKITTDPKTGLITVSYTVTNTDEAQVKITSEIHKKGGVMMAKYTEPNIKGTTSYLYEAAFLPFEIKEGETVVIRAINDAGEAIQSIELVYSAFPPLKIETSSLPNAVVGVAYTQKLSASGGKGPYTWVLSKNFPAGMKFETDGTLSGTPTAEGEHIFTIQVKDASGKDLTALMSLKVVKPAPAAPPAGNSGNNSGTQTGGNGGSGGGGGGSYSGGSGGGGGGGSSASIPPKKDPVKTFTFAFKSTPVANHKDLKDYTLKPHITFLVNAGVVSGYNAEYFGPNDRLTRAQFLKMVVNSFKLPIPKEIPHNPCKDVGKKAWYAPYIATAKSLSIITAQSDGSCLPNEPITRAEATKILFSAILHIDGKTQTPVVAAVGVTDVNPFKDINPKDPLYKYVVSAQKYGFVSGLGKNIFDPKGTLTRGQGAKILINALNKLAVR